MPLPDPPGPRRRQPTAHDVARLAGVSQSAVSRAFTPGASIAAATRARVTAAADLLGYRPNLLARSLITERSGLIAVALGYMENQFYPSILDALSAAFRDAGYRLLLFTQGPAEDAGPILEEVLRFRADAVLVASIRLTSRFAEECARAEVPLVLINRTTERGTASSVTGDNRAGGRAVAGFLAAGGHRRPAFLAGLEDSSTSREREDGFRRGLAEHGLPPPVRAVGQYDTAEARRATAVLMSGAEPPDAIFCANDHMAFAAIETARALGLLVGRDVSVVGFDDVPLASWPSFDLTTYSQPIGPMVRRVVAVTLDHIARSPSAPVQEVVPGTLVVRRSARVPSV